MAASACQHLRRYRVLALDMEGAPLGQITSLLQIATPQREVFVFDVLTLGQELFDASHLLPILTDPMILKLCYDCRGDGSALFLQHGVRAHGLYDLQIVYTSLFQDACDPFLKGLHRAIEKVLSPADAQAFAAHKRGIRCNADTFFQSVLARPLKATTIEYAAGDVEHLFEMHRAWSPYVNERAVRASTLDRTRRHIRRWRAAACGYVVRMPSMSRLDFVPVRQQAPCFVWAGH